MLALDTSSLLTSCALADAGAGGDLRVLAEALSPPPSRAGAVLPEALERVCTQAGSSLEDLQLPDYSWLRDSLVYGATHVRKAKSLIVWPCQVPTPRG